MTPIRDLSSPNRSEIPPTLQPEVLRLVFVLLRTSQGWTQAELAQALELTPSLVSEYESGKRALSRRMVERVADKAGIASEILEILYPAIGALCSSLGGNLDNPGLLLSYFFAEDLRKVTEPLFRNFMDDYREAAGPFRHPPPPLW